MQETDDIVYLEHPVTPEEKAKYRKQGKKIVDVAYAPADHVKEEKSGGSLTVAQLKEKLAAKGVAIPEGAKKADLEALLAANPD